ncbi:MAG: stage III sporulation protein AF [Clostridia bacterium]|nr:stage III sporulation protein AF [Clostridia bacterium]
MENLKSWAVCVVVSSAVAAVIELLAPEGGGEKPVKFITSVFVLFAFVSPFADFEPLPFEYTQGVEDFVEANELQEQIESQAKDSLEAQIKSMLSAYIESIGAVCESVEADVVINSDKDIYLDSITVFISDGDEEAKRKITDYSRENFGIVPEIKVRE